MPFRVIPNIFAQSTHPLGVPPYPNFGLLISRAELETIVRGLQTSNPSKEYKVLYIQRHGQGVHNVAEELYGTSEWDRHYSKMNGNENMTWGPDPQLTALGMQQAEVYNTRWKALLQQNAVTLPQSYYSSPLLRAAHTLHIIYQDISESFRPKILENLRETVGEHTCDKRSSRSAIQARWPAWDIESDFTEEDEKWTAERMETKEEIVDRARGAITDIFERDDHTYIAIASHSGFIRALFHVLGHPEYTVQCAELVPMLVEYDR